MKIEILEVFVTRTDAMTLNQMAAPVGIAALEPEAKPVKTNTKRRSLRQGVAATLSRLVAHHNGS